MQASVLSPGRGAGLYAAGFKDLTTEVPPTELRVTGVWPKWLWGTLLRTGPAQFDLGTQSAAHWFDGLAMLYRFSFAEGRVTYSNRFLRSDVFMSARNDGKFALGGFATEPGASLFQRMMALFAGRRSDNCNIAINAFAHGAIALTEARLPLRFDPQTLETLGPLEIDPNIAGAVSTAHPHYDAKRRRHYSYLVDFGRTSLYRLFAIDEEDGAQTIVAEWPVEQPAYMHSFAMTENYLVLVEPPLVVNPLNFLLRRQPFIRNYHWEPERGLRFHVFEKDSGRHVKTAEADAAFFFHHVNAYERVDSLAVDLVAHADPFVIEQFKLAPLRRGHPVDGSGHLTRYHVPLSAEGTVRREVLARTLIELPRIDYARTAGHRHRVVWGVGTHRRGNFFDSIVKIDVEARAAREWWEEGSYPGEPVYIPRPSAYAEDDGVLMTVVLDARRERSFLVVLDAASLAEIARAECPHAIPFGLHGNFFPGPGPVLSLANIHR